MHYLLVHGAWQAGWCWEPLATLLRQQGHTVSCHDLPGHGKNRMPHPLVTYDIYYQSLADELKKQTKPVVLVAHSMSGILAAPLLDNFPEKIAHLFLIAAFVAQNGETLLDIAISGGPSEIPHLLIDDAKNKAQLLDLKKAKAALYHDCPSEVADWAIKQLQPQPTRPFNTPVKWTDSKKTRGKRTYIFCEEDRDVHPITQQNILKHYACRIVKLKSGHFPFLSQPEALAKILANVPQG